MTSVASQSSNHKAVDGETAPDAVENEPLPPLAPQGEQQGTVPMIEYLLSEYLLLKQRLAALEEQVGVIGVIMSRKSLPPASGSGASIAPGSPLATARAVRRAASPLSHVAGAPSKKHSEGSASSASRAEDAVDRQSLVGGMNSQSVDVDRQGLPFEATRTLSGLSSSTESSVRHAPFPEKHPRQEEEAAGADDGAPATAPGAAPKTPLKPSSDSGYEGSSTKDNGPPRRGSQPSDLDPVVEQGETMTPAATAGGDAAKSLQLTPHSDAGHDFREPSEVNFEEVWSNDL